MKDLIDIKVGDTDSLGRKITEIYIRSTRERTIEVLRETNMEDTSNHKTTEEVKYVIYKTEDNQLQYDELNEYGKKLVPYSPKFNQILELLQVEPLLQKKYYRIVANVLCSIFEKEVEEDYTEILEELKQKIERNLFSIARLEYLKRYMTIMLFAGILVAICVLLPKQYISFETPVIAYFYLGVCGTIGGFFSVVSKINQLPIDPFLPFERSRLDVYVRFVIAALSGILIYWFLVSGFIGFVEETKLKLIDANMPLLLSIAIISGFSERIIPAIITTKEKAYFKSIKK